MKNIWLMARQEFRVLFSDKKALLLLFAMPALLIVFISLALTDVYHQKVGKKLNVLVLTENTSLAGAIVEQFSQFEYSVDHKTNPGELDLTRVEGDYDAVLRLPKGVGKLIRGEKSADKIQVYFDPVLDKSYQELIKSHFLLSLQSLVIDQVNKKMAQQQSQSESKAIQVDKLVDSKEILSEVKKGQVIPNPIQQTVPAWALFAMFFIAIPMSTSFIRDRDNGVFTRLLGYEIRNYQILIGKFIPYFVINNVQFFSMLFLGLLVVPQLTDLSFKFSAPIFSLLGVSLVCSLAATSYGLVISTFSKTIDQASNFGAIAIVLMALLGGVMVPHFIMPAFMQKLSLFSPLYWGLESFLDIFMRQLDFTEILPRIYILFLFAICCLLVSTFKFKRSV